MCARHQVGITPTINQSGVPVTLHSQTAENDATSRIPQDLSSLMKAGTITQDLLDNPNTFQRRDIASQTIISTTTISIATSPRGPLFGAAPTTWRFSLAPPQPRTLSMQATTWIETVKHEGIRSVQIQYSQQVFLNCSGLPRLHVLVATLRPITKSG